MSIKARAFARGAGKSVTVFPRASVTMTEVSAARAFWGARAAIATASKEAQRKLRHDVDLAGAE